MTEIDNIFCPTCGVVPKETHKMIEEMQGQLKAARVQVGMFRDAIKKSQDMIDKFGMSDLGLLYDVMNATEADALKWANEIRASVWETVPTLVAFRSYKDKVNLVKSCLKIAKELREGK